MYGMIRLQMIITTRSGTISKEASFVNEKLFIMIKKIAFVLLHVWQGQSRRTLQAVAWMATTETAELNPMKTEVL